MFFGSIPALVTPFSGGRVAEDTFAEMVEWQIAEGSSALVPCGTTGEGATLTDRGASPADRDDGRNGARAGCRCLPAADRTTRPCHRADAGCQATRARTPRSTFRLITTGPIRRGFTRISRRSPSIELPIILYNVPSRTITDISVETMAQAGAAAQCHRGQGRDRKPCAGVGAAPGLRRGVHPAERQ